MIKCTIYKAQSKAKAVDYFVFVLFMHKCAALIVNYCADMLSVYT